MNNTNAKITDLFQYRLKYDGLKKGEHRIDLNELGKSLQGFANAFSIIGTYSVSDRITSKSTEYKVSITTDAKIYEGSVEIWAIISATLQCCPNISDIKNLFDAVCTFIFSKREQSDMDKFLEYLESRDQKDLEKDEMRHEENLALINIISKCVDPNLKNCLAPIGKTCNSIKLGVGNNNQVEKEVSVIDSNVKNNLLARNHEKEEISKTIEIILVALNKKTCSCQFYFNEDYVNKEDDDANDISTYSGKITDPNFELASNSYTKAFDSNTPIKVIAKIKHNTNNDIYYISDIIPNRQNE